MNRENFRITLDIKMCTNINGKLEIFKIINEYFPQLFLSLSST